LVNKTKLTLDDVVRFQQELESLARSGLPLADGIRRLAEDASASAKLREAATATATQLAQGKSLSESLDTANIALPQIMLRMIRAGEATGGLAPLLSDLVRDGNRELLFRSNLRTTLSYPLVILVFGTAMFGSVYSFVIPRLHATLTHLEQDTVQASTLLRDLAALTGAHLYIVLPVGVLLIAFLLHRLTGIARVQYAMLSLGLRLPFVGPFILMHHAQLWCRSLAHLLRGGVALDEALELVADTLPHALAVQATRDAASRVRRGGRLTENLAANFIMPPSFEWSVARAEERGDLVAMLAELAELADVKRELHRQRLLIFLEPLLLVFLGMLIGALVILTYFPLAQLPRLFF
jgi:type IV pilus assembly protein PilC